MRICIVSDLYYPYPGGVSEHVHHTAIGLRELGHEVKILTTNYWGLKNTCNSSDIVRVGIGVPFFINQSVGVIPMGVGLNSKVRNVVSDHFDVVHLHTPHIAIPILALRHSRAVNIITFHSNAPFLKWHKYITPYIYPYACLIDGAIAVSQDALDTMLRLVSIPYTIIPNGVDIERFSPYTNLLPKFATGGPNILFVGRLDPRKGLKYLIQAFHKVNARFPTAKLIVVGKGVIDSKFQLPNVYFEGLVPPEDVPRYYAGCDIYCSPATGRESFGIVLLEAMSSGKPVIASNIDGYKRVITNGKDGILVPAQDSDALARALIKVLLDKELQIRLSTEGRNTALKYSWQKVVKEIETFYYETIAKKNSKSEILNPKQIPMSQIQISKQRW
ncbi:MAG: glycosyltransferase family 4 protein [Candidatus Stahlbacteria bacterium]|nr:glycosyltransferase family 4 protein [Candidatus Stahlbacteria bacterium]